MSARSLNICPSSRARNKSAVSAQRFLSPLTKRSPIVDRVRALLIIKMSAAPLQKPFQILNRFLIENTVFGGHGRGARGFRRGDGVFFFWATSQKRNGG